MSQTHDHYATHICLHQRTIGPAVCRQQTYHCPNQPHCREQTHRLNTLQCNTNYNFYLLIYRGTEIKLTNKGCNLMNSFSVLSVNRIYVRTNCSYCSAYVRSRAALLILSVRPSVCPNIIPHEFLHRKQKSYKMTIELNVSRSRSSGCACNFKFRKSEVRRQGHRTSKNCKRMAHT